MSNDSSAETLSEENNNLKDLQQLATEIIQKYNDSDIHGDIHLPRDFKEKYSKFLGTHSKSVTFSECTALITTSEGRLIYCPNQWFYLAAIFSDYVLALYDYKLAFNGVFSGIVAKEREKLAKDYKANGLQADDPYEQAIEDYFDSDVDRDNFIKLLTEYSWWGGSKTIDRTDYYVSPVLSMANVVNVTQTQIADIAKEFADNPELKVLLNSGLEEMGEDRIKSKFALSEQHKGSLDFPYKNILLKGVPGTGKSHLIDKIITDSDKLDLAKNDPNVLRINIHSASSNADLMQGIGITTTDNDQIVYREKQGLILNHIKKAIEYPKQPFVIVLEEIQENSLNELIGDLIYLIEEKKRTDLSKEDSTEYDSIEAFTEAFIQKNPETFYVEIPYLVSTETVYKKMILPNNIFIFCTSNYRDDKKVIEDNLLRRFEVIEVYPANKELIGSDFKNQDISDFLDELNDAIVQHFHKHGEIHPDRFMIGHAIWLDVAEVNEFYKALLKVVTEFKDIKELSFESDLRPILKSLEAYPFDINKEDLIKGDYKEQVDYLQKLSYSSLFALPVSLKEKTEEGIVGASENADVNKHTKVSVIEEDVSEQPDLWSVDS